VKYEVSFELLIADDTALDSQQIYDEVLTRLRQAFRDDWDMHFNGIIEMGEVEVAKR